MKIELTFADFSVITIDRFEEFCFNQSAGVACDSLWAYFLSENELGEISCVKAYENKALIFNGYCDCQKEIINENGRKYYFYARSSASVLVDNEALPLTYNKPSATQLCYNIASDKGFHSSLKRVCSNSKYEITKGTSCYGAISNFVRLTSGKDIRITPENEIRLLDYSEDVIRLDKSRVVSACHTINRSEPYLEIAFKKSNDQSDYNVHTRSSFGEGLGISKSALINLSALPQWQRENMVLERIKKSYEDYKVLKLTCCGYVSQELLQRFNYMEYENYALTDKKYFCNSDGKFTILTMKKIIDIKEITYVD